MRRCEPYLSRISRRSFLTGTAAATAGVWCCSLGILRGGPNESAGWKALPRGKAPPALEFPHFPTRAHAFVWRNWTLIPADRMARVLRCASNDVRRMARAMGLPAQGRISREIQARGYITVIRRNWHLLPYEQLLELLEWTPEQMAYTLREDDFLFIKLGSLKPECPPLRYAAPTAQTLADEKEVRRVVQEDVGSGFLDSADPLFGFVEEFSSSSSRFALASGETSLKLCYSYLALYGDPLLNRPQDSFPAGYMARLQQIGVNAVWLHSVLHKLSPLPWSRTADKDHETRLANLGSLVEHLDRFGIKAFLYLNEPRAMPVGFFEGYPELKGATEGEHAALCTSQPVVREYLVNSIQSICKAVPGIGGFLSISGSENFTHCWSHGGGHSCPRCSKRPAAEVVAELNTAFWQGIQASGAKARLLVWDWGWNDNWAPDAIRRLPPGVDFMSVSEWRLPIERGGVKTEVGEYSISAIGPGPRATSHWRAAREHGLSIVAKIQAGNTWELAAVPYIPAVSNVARHVENLREAGIRHLMLGWTLGGYPSPNLEIAASVVSGRSGQQAVEEVAARRFGGELAPLVVTAWDRMSAAFSEYPYHGGVVYCGPQHMGPANLLWIEPTGYAATMVGLPYDDLDAWRAVYPAQVFVDQFEKVASGFERAIEQLRAAAAGPEKRASRGQRLEFRRECAVAEAAGIHFRSAANQARFILARSEWRSSSRENSSAVSEMKRLLHAEIGLSLRLCELQRADSRLGFEASNHYFFIPSDLGEKILNCRNLLKRLDAGNASR